METSEKLFRLVVLLRYAIESASAFLASARKGSSLKALSKVPSASAILPFFSCASEVVQCIVIALSGPVRSISRRSASTYRPT